MRTSLTDMPTSDSMTAGFSRSSFVQKPFIVFALIGLSSSLHGQGHILFDNLGASAEQKVYIDEWLNPAALPPGGTEFLVALYFARIEDGETALTQIGAATGFAGSPGYGGIFSGGVRVVPTTFPGQPGFFQVKGWESAYGSSYEEAAANPDARIGNSPIFLAATANRTTATESALGLVGFSFPSRPFQGFVIAVPEPSTALLALAGIVTIALVLRRPKA